MINLGIYCTMRNSGLLIFLMQQIIAKLCHGTANWEDNQTFRCVNPVSLTASSVDKTVILTTLLLQDSLVPPASALTYFSFCHLSSIHAARTNLMPWLAPISWFDPVNTVSIMSREWNADTVLESKYGIKLNSLYAMMNIDCICRVVIQILKQIAKTLGSTSIRHRSDVKVSNRYPVNGLRYLWNGLTLCVPVLHYCDVIMKAMASQITSLTIVYSTVHLGPDQRKHQSSASLAFVLGIHRSSANSQRARTRKMFPFDDVIMSHMRNPYLVTTVPAVGALMNDI